MRAEPTSAKAGEVALTVRTLASGGLPYSVGQAIRVDGGLLVSKFRISDSASLDLGTLWTVPRGEKSFE
jgi:hypothetical protein